MTHNEIRKRFLDFFKSKNHTIVPSDALVPAGDPTVLFTSAGMNQFKEQFLGHIKGFTRAASCQKCLRTDDLKNVGVTSYHHTFFEMLGNFSFGDYFKPDAIKWAWEFLTENLKLKTDSLWVSVYKDDQEAYDIWKDIIKVPSQKIIKLGDKENFWPQEAKKKGPSGPCGPCSEIFYDYGKDHGCGRKECSPACDCGRFVEVWNLVFTQFNRKEGGALEPLPKKNIDTGMGLERLCAVMQGVDNNFKTDLFTPIIESIKHELETKDNRLKERYAIADHIRAVSFAICDGIVPSNEERGYVIRNLIRKSVLQGRVLGAQKPFLYKLVSSVSNVMQEPYPELKKRRDNISQIILAEEEKFAATLQEGTAILEEQMDMLREKGISEISGEFMFRLFDTHGFPFDMANEIAIKNGFRIDEKGFKQLMERQRSQSRRKSQMQEAIFKEPLTKEKVEFVGYEKLKTQAKVIKIFKEGKAITQLNENETADVILDKSPFYAESGGQVGDTGTLESKALKAKVINAKKEADAIVLKVFVEKGNLRTNDTVKSAVDEERRLAVAKNHTATHILQGALRKVLGEHVQQQGSLVAPDRLRFDFTHFKALSQYELERVEQLVNEKIKQASPVKFDVMDIDEAKKKGALAFFGDKYDMKVRVVSAGDYSAELCGGTHVKNTKDIAVFKIISESSIASGIRRIEAVTDKQAFDIIKQEQQACSDICVILKCKPQDAVERLKQLFSDFEKLKIKLKTAVLNQARQSIDTVINNATEVKGISLIVFNIDGAGPEIMRNTVDVIREKLKQKSWVAFLSSLSGNQAYIVIGLSRDLAEKGLNAGRLISKIAALAGGSGGGSRDMAVGGIKNTETFNDVMKKGKEIILEEIKK